MGLNRRGFLLQSLALSAGPVGSAAWAQAQAKLEDSLVIRTTGGVFEQALKRNFFDPFNKATGVKVVPVAASYGEMMAKTAAMNASGRIEWDIISPQYYELGKLSNVLADLGDCSAMPNVAKEGVSNACGQYGVLYLIGGQVLTWSTQAFKDKRPTKSPRPVGVARVAWLQTLARNAPKVCTAVVCAKAVPLISARARE